MLQPMILGFNKIAQAIEKEVNVPNDEMVVEYPKNNHGHGCSDRGGRGHGHDGCDRGDEGKCSHGPIRSKDVHNHIKEKNLFTSRHQVCSLKN